LLKGKVALVTGSAKGIGFEIAREFASRAANVIICSRRLKDAQVAAARIPNAEAAELDITDDSSVERLANKLSADYGSLDILVNNAGYPFDRKIWYKEFHKVDDQEFKDVLAVDLRGSFRITRAVIPLMIKKGGVIINISSTPAVSGHTEGAPYTMAKSALIAMTKHIALEYGKKNIRAYTLALGNIASEATFNSMTPAERKKAANENAMKRWGRPEEVAKVAACLASDDFSFVTGNTIIVDGGTVLL
jgi:3-oxoacyl-[acyl-carrier protein] reductase